MPAAEYAGVTLVNLFMVLPYIVYYVDVSQGQRREGKKLKFFIPFFYHNFPIRI